MDIRTLSGLGRPLDFAYPTNRWIAGITVVVFLAAWGLIGVGTEQWAAASADALRLALAVFLAWAVCRELDPDRDRSALAAAVLCAAALSILPLAAGAQEAWSPGIAECFVLLLALRVLNRTTGAPATLADAAGLLALGVWLAVAGPGWLYLAGARSR